MRTLIVEDDFTSRLLLQTILSAHGECHVAVNGQEAVDAFHMAADSARPYDLICMDIMLPLKSGLTALKEIRGREAFWKATSTGGWNTPVKVIMTTAVAGNRNVEAAFDELCDAYLVKPLDRAKLLSLIKSFGLIP